MKRIFALAFLALLILACSKEDNAPAGTLQNNNGQKTIFYATMEGQKTTGNPDTKVYADENMLVLWNEDDRISIFNMSTYNRQFKFLGENGDNYGSFEEIPASGFISGLDINQIVAVYPYSTNNKMNNAGTSVIMNLPEEQTYKENSFGLGSNTMVAVSDNNYLSFKNVGGYISLRLYGDVISVSSIILRGNNNEKISGKASIAVSSSAAPATTMDHTATETITLVCDPPVRIGTTAEEYTDFWFVVPPTTFSNGFTITVNEALGGTFEKTTTNSFTVTRNQMDWMNPLKVEIEYDEDNTFVPFDDANFKAYCVENFDTNGDGEISLSEAKLVTEISVLTDKNHKNITSLKGIEYFKNLTRLICSGYGTGGNNLGQITSLDLSNNTNLTLLDCRKNQLTSLDVSHNLVLDSLNCYYNQLTSLDISQNTSLTYLSLGYNQISYLDVSNNTALNTLYCYNTQISSLDVSNNTALNTLYCYNTQITSLDVSNNTALTYLYCYNTQISSLDVSNNTALRSLYCYNTQITSLDVSNNTALTYLYCDNTQISSLDVSNNTALTYLSCDNTQISSLDVSNNTALTNLYCDNTQITSLDVSNNTALKYLYCYNTPITSLDASNLSLMSLYVYNCPALTELNCCNNQLINLNVNDNPVLTTLNCSNNQLTSLDISTNSNLTNLTAWPQNGTLGKLYICEGHSIQYKNSEGVVVEPSDYGTEVIGRTTYQYDDYKNIIYDGFWAVDLDKMAFTYRPGFVDEYLVNTSAKLQKSTTSASHYRLVFLDGAASIEFKNNGDGTISVDKYPGYNDGITLSSSGQIDFKRSVYGHTYQFQLRVIRCSIIGAGASSPDILSGDDIELEGWVARDGSWLGGGYNMYMELLVN